MPLIADDLEHGGGVGCLFEGLAEFGTVKELGDIGKSVKVLLKLALRHEEEHDKINRLVVERVEIDALLGASQSANDLVNEIGGGMRNANTETNPCAHGGLALFDNRRNSVVMLGLDLAG